MGIFFDFSKPIQISKSLLDLQNTPSIPKFTQRISNETKVINQFHPPPQILCTQGCVLNAFFYGRHSKLKGPFSLSNVSPPNMLPCPLTALRGWFVLGASSVSFDGAAYRHRKKVLSHRSSDLELLHQRGTEEVCLLVPRQNPKSRNAGKT